MNTQISILFKEPSAYTTGRILFTKSRVTLIIDGDEVNPVVLQADKKPQILPLAPGGHKIYFKYDNTFQKFGTKAMGAVMGFALGGFDGSGLSAAAGADLVSTLGGYNKTYDNLLECYLNEGDTLHISITPKRNGEVKIKIL